VYSHFGSNTGKVVFVATCVTSNNTAQQLIDSYTSKSGGVVPLFPVVTYQNGANNLVTLSPRPNMGGANLILGPDRKYIDPNAWNSADTLIYYIQKALDESNSVVNKVPLATQNKSHSAVQLRGTMFYFHEKVSDAVVRVVGSNGRVLVTRSIAGESSFDVAALGLSSGVYAVQITGKNFRPLPFRCVLK